MSKWNKFLCILTLMFLINFSVKAYAANTVMTLNIDGEIVDYNQPNVTMKVDGSLAKQGDMPPIIINDRTLIPVRELFESMGSKVEWINETREVIVSLDDAKIELKIGSSNVKITKDGKVTNKTIDVPAKIINSKTMIPLRAVGEGLGCNVEWINSTRTILIESPQKVKEDEELNKKDQEKEIEIEDNEVAEGIEKGYFDWDATKKTKVEKTNLENKVGSSFSVVGFANNKKSSYEEITIKLDGMAGKITEQKTSNGTTIAVNLFDAKVVDALKDTTLDTNLISKIRFGNHGTYSTVALDLKGNYPYYIRLNSDRTKLFVRVYKTEILRATYSETNVGNLTVRANGQIDVTSSRLTEPDRVYINVTGAVSYLGTRNAKLDSKFVKEIRTSYDSKTNTTRFTLELNDQFDYNVYNDAYNEVRLEVLENKLTKTTYSNTNERTLTLEGVNVSENDLQITEDYFEGIYEIDLGKNFESKIGTGSLFINDGFVDSFEITTNKTTKIKFIPDNGNVISIIPDKQLGKLVLKLVTPGEKYDEVVVLDPGHALNANGNLYDSGAANGDCHEQVYNFNLAMAAKDYIEQNSNVKVYMTRETKNYKTTDQSFANYIESYTARKVETNPNLRGRTRFANAISADMFVSIHNNWIGNGTTNYNGTAVYYENNKYANGQSSIHGLTNKELATIIAEEIHEGTEGNYYNDKGKTMEGTLEDGVRIDNTGYAVLRYSTRPAVLIETQVMNNKEDMQRLNSSDYIKKAGESIAKGILRAFAEYDLADAVIK